MKRIALFAGVLAIAASCSVKEMETATVPAPQMFGYTEEDQPTKTAITVDGEGVGTIWWKPADNINVFFETASVRYYSTNQEDATTVVFETNAMIGSTESASTNKWGLYPYNSAATCDGSTVTTTIPAAQQCVPETFGNNLFPMIAHTATNELHFKNVCGGIKFSLSRDDIQSITFKGNNNENIAGSVRLSLDGEDNPVASVVAGEKTITLTPSTGTTFASGTNYYLVMLPTVLSGGFTMTFDTENEIGTFEYTAKSIEIKRSIFAKKADIDTYASFVPKDLTPDYIEGGVNLGKGIAVLGDWNNDGIQTILYWAPVNCGYEETGRAGKNSRDDHRLGKLYQWGAGDSSIPYKYNGSPVVARERYGNEEIPSPWYKNISGTASDQWKSNQGPCPMGWRLPTKNEFEVLRAGKYATNVYHNYGTYAGQVNQYEGIELFGANIDKTEGTGVFFPLTGHLNENNGYFMYGDQGSYWSSDVDANWGAFILYFTYSALSTSGSNSRANGYSVRCVKK